MGAAVEGQIHISRFSDLPVNARERLLRCRGRHFAGFEAVVRFRDETLDYELVISGPAAPHFAEILELKNQFGSIPFSPKSLYSDIGMSRATAHRMISRLAHAGVLKKAGYGQYALTREIREKVETK
jgi:hypothetical protein